MKVTLDYDRCNYHNHHNNHRHHCHHDQRAKISFFPSIRWSCSWQNAVTLWICWLFRLSVGPADGKMPSSPSSLSSLSSSPTSKNPLIEMLRVHQVAPKGLFLFQFPSFFHFPHCPLASKLFFPSLYLFYIVFLFSFI